jgi:glycine cleavage system aminomethyltransferase T
MDWAVKMDKPDFLGRRALERTAPLPDDRRLHGFTMASPAPVEGSVIRLAGDGGGAVVGQVTSSFDSPMLGHAVLLGWLRRRPFPTEVEIDGRRAVVAPTPFFDPEGVRARA